MYQYEYEESIPKYCDICSYRINDDEMIVIKYPNIKAWYHKSCYNKMLKFKNPLYKNIHNSTAIPLAVGKGGFVREAIPLAVGARKGALPPTLVPCTMQNILKHPLHHDVPTK